jgi:hypothetical protein
VGTESARVFSLAIRRELIQAITERYHSGTRIEKKILNEFIEVTGFTAGILPDAAKSRRREDWGNTAIAVAPTLRF